jgi:DNA-binding beta-propeller fold protein YncE
LFANTLVDSARATPSSSRTAPSFGSVAEIGGTISVFDVETQAEKAKIDFEVQGVHPDRVQPVGFEFTDDDKHAFVALGPSNHVAVVNAETYEVEDYILVGRRVWHMAFNTDKSLLFTTNGVSGDVTVIDVANARSHQDHQGRPLPLGRRPAPLTLHRERTVP